MRSRKEDQGGSKLTTTRLFRNKLFRSGRGRAVRSMINMNAGRIRGSRISLSAGRTREILLDGVHPGSRKKGFVLAVSLFFGSFEFFLVLKTCIYLLLLRQKDRSISRTANVGRSAKTGAKIKKSDLVTCTTHNSRCVLNIQAPYLHAYPSVSLQYKVLVDIKLAQARGVIAHPCPLLSRL